jgi:hypothetical protein
VSEAIESEQVNDALALPDAGMIETLTFDVLRQTITFQVHQTWNPHHEEWHMAVFEGVASFYVVRWPGEWKFKEVFNRPPTEFTTVGEWTSAGYHPEGVGQVRIHAKPGSWEEGWVGRYSTRPNFSIEIGRGMLLIEARVVRVDDQIFEVGFIHDSSLEDDQ